MPETEEELTTTESALLADHDDIIAKLDKIEKQTEAQIG